ncbi:hypothetical protein [Vibrio phage vB_VibM_83AMN]|nr:hypothetical protein [Vibrio phage vB_VibM_83AMN]
MSKPIESNKLHFNAGTRLMCPDCLTVSNHHIAVETHEFVYLGGKPYIACYHVCYKCGASDMPWTGEGTFMDANKQFIDSANYESYDYNHNEINHAQEQVKILERELNHYKDLLEKAEKHYASLWQTDEDA